MSMCIHICVCDPFTLSDCIPTVDPLPTFYNVSGAFVLASSCHIISHWSSILQFTVIG